MDHAAAGAFRDLKTLIRGSAKACGHLAPQRSQLSAHGYDMAQTMLPRGQGAVLPRWARADDRPSGTVCHPGPVAPCARRGQANPLLSFFLHVLSMLMKTGTTLRRLQDYKHICLHFYRHVCA